MSSLSTPFGSTLYFSAKVVITWSPESAMSTETTVPSESFVIKLKATSLITLESIALSRLERMLPSTLLMPPFQLSRFGKY